MSFQSDGCGRSVRSRSRKRGNFRILRAGEFVGGGVSQAGNRHVANDDAVVTNDGAVAVRDDADLVAGQFPLVTDCAGGGDVLRGHDEQHPLLRLGKHDFVGSHSLFAAGDSRHINVYACIGARGAFNDGACEPARAEVLHSHQQPRGGNLQAALQYQLLKKWVAHLHGGAALRGLLGEVDGGESCSVDAVAARVSADEEHHVARAAGAGADNLVLTRDADAHGVDEGVGGVGGRECHLPRNVRDADAVAVAADACDDALKEVAVAGALLQWAKEQGIEEGDGPRAHAEYVTNDAADARRRALVWLDG